MRMVPKSGNTCSESRQRTCKAGKCITRIYDYDLIVIGDGCGGISAAKEASALGAKVAVLGQVTSPSSDTQWSLNQLSDNIGCVTKKLLHQAALLGEATNDSRHYGWEINENIYHDWKCLTDAIKRHINYVSSSIRAELKEKQIRYIYSKGSFKDPHTLHVTTEDYAEQLTAQYILIAVGTELRYPDIPGAKEYATASDDLLSLKNSPGKSLIIGSGSAGVECAGFLITLNYDVTMIDRTSVRLKRFDQQMANMVLDEMEKRGVKFLLNCRATSISRSNCSGKLKISWENDKKQEFTEDFDTIILATGRKTLAKELNLENAGVQVASDGEHIDAVNEQTNISHIYAVGDVLYGRPNLATIATRAGLLVSRRLFGGSKELMDYDMFGTNLFTPIEYGVVGLSEETAISQYGEESLEVYHGYYKPSEFFLPERKATNCYLKVIGLREEKRTILGMHFIGPNAGEVIQGFVTALKCGLTIDGLLNTVGVHTTNAEEFTKLSVTKRSGNDPRPAACCS